MFGISLPDAIAQPPGEGGTINLPAVVLVLAITALLVVGVRESARANTVMVILKLAILVFFIVVGVTAFNGDNFSPFAPHGIERRGRRRRADLLRLHRLRRGLDVGRGDRRPARDLPIAIVGSLVIATVLYILVAIVATGSRRRTRSPTPRPR